ncbi:MAG TPA: hypothetical protein VMU05_20300 [Dongiaceae bacterium]|nr:hypothetical protein [Dongiaceae bacterium]
MADGSISSSPERARQNHRGAWSSWALPSVADLIFVAVLASLVFTPLSVKLLGDAGVGWHIRTGQLILSTHAVPHVDPFSTQIQKSWIAWEWLYDVLVGALDSSAGLNGVVWVTATVIAGVFAGMFALLVRRGTDLLVALLLTLLAIAASMIHFLARPHVLSWLFALPWFWILSSYESGSEKGRWHIWLLPMLMLIWANVHGGFLLGFVLLAIFWLGSLWTWLRQKESRLEESLEKIAAGRRVRQLSVMGFVSAGASLVNPYGWNLHAHIYSYLTNRFFMNHIEEFQSPNFHGLAQRCFLILLLIAVAVLALRGRRLRASEILIVLFAVYAGLYASRNIPIASIFLVLIAGPLIPTVGVGGFGRRMIAVDSRLRGHMWPLAAAFATLLIALNGGRAGSAQLMDAHFNPQRMPVAAVDFLQKHEDHGVRDPGPGCGRIGAILGPDYWGGYFIYRLYPRTKVVIDDRHDFYGEPFLKSYLTMMHVEPGWRDFLDGHSCLVLPRKAALGEILTQSPDWGAIYSDDVSIVFKLLQFPADRNKVPEQ